MKVLFLDIDGVLNSFKWAILNPPGLLFRTIQDIDPSNMKVLVSFLNEKKDIQVVISSDWRKLVSLEELKNIFSHFGFPIERIIGYTPVHLNSHKRGEEISSFLKNNLVESYVILDNDNFVEELSSRLVLTDPNEGLIDSDLTKLKELFNQ